MRPNHRARPAALTLLLALLMTLPTTPSLAVAPSAVGAEHGWGSRIAPGRVVMAHIPKRVAAHAPSITDTVDRVGRPLATGQPLTTEQATTAALLARQAKVVSGTALSTWQVSYQGSFTTNLLAQLAFQRAVDIWSHVVSSSQKIVVTASLTTFTDASQLGGAGPTGFVSSPAGVWYPVALANALRNTDVGPGTADIDADFADNPNIFYYGADPAGIATKTCTIPGETPRPGNCFDFESVVLHELAHGLGFIGSVATYPSGVFYGNSPTDQQPYVYDLFTETSDGTAILDRPDGSQALDDAVTSNAVYWNGPQGSGADRGREPRLYAPNTGFEDGSSFSHLSDASYPIGDPDALMTPFADEGDITRDPGEVALGMFRDMGWVTPALPGAAYTPLANPVQVYDSGGAVSNGALKDVTLAGTNGIPANATAVVLNLTAATLTSANSQLFVYAKPRPSPLPPSARVPNLVAAGGYTKDGLTTVPLAFGGVRFKSVGGAAHEFAAAVGYFTVDGGTPYIPATPRRVIDTRTGTGIPKARIGGSVAVAVPGVPSEAVAVVLHVTGINPSNTSTLQVFSSDVSTPSTGNVHLKPGQSATNLVIAKLGADHKIKVRETLGGTDLVVELVGWYAPSATGRYRPLLPQRLFGPLPLGATSKDLKAVGGREGFGVPVDATSLVLDTVASFPSATTFQATYATGSFPGITTLTVYKGKSASGPTMTRPSSGGSVRVRNAAGSATDSLDLFGYYAP